MGVSQSLLHISMTFDNIYLYSLAGCLIASEFAASMHIFQRYKMIFKLWGFSYSIHLRTALLVENVLDVTITHIH